MVKLSDQSPTKSPSRLCHIVLRTEPEKYGAMVEWYVTFLKAKVVWGNERLSFLSYDDEHHRIAITGFEGAVPRAAEASRACGLAHVAFAYDSLEDLLTGYLHWKKAGILPTWCVNHGPTTSMYYRDPDGNEVEAQVDNFETNEEATDFMNGPEFFENPFGVDFDPEDLIRRLESGESDGSMKKRHNIGPRSSR